MKIGSGPIIVPWDFSEVADNALKTAIRVTNKVNKEIVLLHIARKSKDVSEYGDRLVEIAYRKSVKYKRTIKSLIKTGNIFTKIGQTANELDAELIVMGTHGMKGMQKITGSWALKVVLNTSTPFIVVQKPPKNKAVKNVILPVDFRTSAKDKLRWVEYLHQLYAPKFYLLKPNFTDTEIIRKIKANTFYCRNYFDNANISFEMDMTEGKMNFVDETVEYAKKKNGDLILIVAPRKSFADYLLGSPEQHIIANHKSIPVMVISNTQ